MIIRPDDLKSAEVLALLEEHLKNMAEYSPPGSRHALDLEALEAEAVTFWTVWDGTMLMGCGALKELSAAHGEIKSMRTANQHLRKGVAANLLRHIIQEAQKRRYQHLSLETGSMDAFAAAAALYMRFGFTECEPFADYQLDPHSIFMTRTF